MLIFKVFLSLIPSQPSTPKMSLAEPSTLMNEAEDLPRHVFQTPTMYSEIEFPPVDLAENPEYFVLQAGLSGYKKSQVSLSIEN